MLREFLMRFDAEGNVKFADTVDKAAFRSLLSAMRHALKSKGKDEVFILGVDFFEDTTTDKQEVLFNILCRLIANESGNDFTAVKETLLKNHSGEQYKAVKLMPKEEFQIFIEKCIVFTNEYFSLNITTNAAGHFQAYKL